MFLFCLVFAMFCARLFICALWSPAGKGLTSWLSFVVSSVSLSLSLWYPGSGVVLDCIDSWSLQPYYFAQGPQPSDAGEARTRGPSVSGQALYHWATALPTLALSLHGWAMCFAHPRTELNILSKGNDNPSRVWGDMEHTRNWRLHSITYNCNPDFESA